MADKNEPLSLLLEKTGNTIDLRRVVLAVASVAVSIAVVMTGWHLVTGQSLRGQMDELTYGLCMLSLIVPPILVFRLTASPALRLNLEGETIVAEDADSGKVLGRAKIADLVLDAGTYVGQGHVRPLMPLATISIGGLLPKPFVVATKDGRWVAKENATHVPDHWVPRFGELCEALSIASRFVFEPEIEE